jgi:hypothetical protein
MCQFLGRSLVSWSSKKQTFVALSTAEAEYIAAGQCCAQLLWMRQTLKDFGYNLSKVPLLCDNESCRRLETGGSLSRRVSVPRTPAQMGRARGRARRGEARWPETGVREVKIPRPSCSSRAQVGCACSRGLQASTRVREASGPKRAPVPSSSPRGQPSLRRPWSFLL